jgi:hypothetical protein
MSRIIEPKYQHDAKIEKNTKERRNPSKEKLCKTRGLLSRENSKTRIGLYGSVEKQ